MKNNCRRLLVFFCESVCFYENVFFIALSCSRLLGLMITTGPIQTSQMQQHRI